MIYVVEDLQVHTTEVAVNIQWCSLTPTNVSSCCECLCIERQVRIRGDDDIAQQNYLDMHELILLTIIVV